MAKSKFSTDNVSVHPSVQEMYQHLKADNMSNTFDRFPAQEKIRCNFCSAGLSCQLCTNGPCRISDKTGAVLGVCGIDRNAMAMRDMLLRNVMGTATYSYQAYEAFRTLKATALGQTPYEIKSKDKLYDFSKQLGVDTSGSEKDVAIRLADYLQWELHRGYDEPSKIIDIFAPPQRVELWRKLALYPSGPLHEIKDATASCLTNIDGDYVSLARKALRLSISCIYGAQVAGQWAIDIVLGTPYPHEVQYDMGILDPEYVNVVFNGHEPFDGAALVLKAREAEMQELAKKAGAKGLRVIGSIESGQEIVQRFELDDVFRGLIGNWLFIEPMLATGAVDFFGMSENCSPPYLAPYQEKYQVTLASTTRLVRVPGVEKHYDYKPQEIEGQAKDMIMVGVENFKKRKGKVKSRVPQRIQKGYSGFGVEALLQALGGSVQPLIDVIAANKIKGAVGLVNCTTLANGPHDYMTTELTRELIKRDIIVLSGGCGNQALEVAGFTSLDAIEWAGPGLQEVCKSLNIPPVLSFGTCTDTGRIAVLVSELAKALNVDSADLPVAVTAPQYMEQKATIDGIFSLAFGLYTHLSPTPPIAGGPELVKLLTEDLVEITGGRVALGDEPDKVADGIEQYIKERREHLGLKN
ncbi:anaerobic carbon-monoxide dehydrogenase catalytic subunit [Metallumcola ferriviriculae]|uniref:Carbon monoxide dehydrogenase n=1 Tax=Metallumcola ferriviriculae TaxID=3039180 RepID=A0AAU0UK67_9FIRM|nr:anaerobic carbon-monoxide dehydrogenase catalytic subunit [Desulfitibacteraceae bacterium MK1]